MKKYTVTGMTCAACVSRVENAVKKVSGIESCAVNLLTNTLSVEGNVSEKDIVSAVEKAGYGVKRADAPVRDTKADLIVTRLIFSGAILLVLMYIAMGHMLSLPLPQFLHNGAVSGVCQLVLSGIVLVINQRFFINGFKGAVHLTPNMDTLVALGSGASFVYSVYLVILQILSPAPSAHYYFESAAMILVLITVGKLLESHSKGKTTSALKALMDLSPKTATLLIDGEQRVVPAQSVKVDDVFVVRPGESIPVDAVVIEGESAIDESALTGESVPCDKSVGESVFAATINLSGFLKCRAIRVGEDTALSKIIKMVSDVGATKAPVQKIADKVSGVFVPVVLGVSLITAVSWLLLGQGFEFSLTRAISVLVISCPCALGLATPVAIMVGNGVGAKNGILFKTAAALEITGKVKTVLLDKTGTVTKGEPQVTEIICYDESLLSVALSLEKKSEHPLAKAVVKKAVDSGVTLKECLNFKALSGVGVCGEIDGETVFGASVKYISGIIHIPDDVLKQADDLSKGGATPLMFTKGEKLLGIIAVADTVKEDSAEAVEELKKMGLEVIMLTGDNQNTAKAIAKKVGIDKVIAEVMPNNKAEVVKSCQKDGRVLMVGDGINDAVALTAADIGVAIGSGTDVAIDAADVVVVRSSLKDVATAVKLSRKAVKNIYENLFWAFLYNVIGIPLAAGVFGLSLSPMFSAAAMSLSSFCVVSNALRLNFFKANKKEKKKMEVVIRIEGMMCPHCEAHVKKALEGVSGVIQASASHKDGTAVVKLENGVDLAVLKAVIENAGYKVIG